MMTKYVPHGATVPLDIAVIAGYLLVSNVLLYVVPTGNVVVRSLVGVPLLFLVPGYVLVAALFPGQKAQVELAETDDTDARQTDSDSRRLDWRERLALSFGSSVALLPLLGLALSVSGLGYNAVTIVSAISIVSALGLIPAVVYRLREPPTKRLEVPTSRWSRTLDEGIFEQDNRTAALNVVVAVVVLVSVASVGYAMVAPNNAESFTSVSLLTTNEDGDLVASGYPETIGEDGTTLTVQLENDEGAATEYTVVAELQRVRTAGTTTTVVEREEVARMNTEVAAGETWTRQHTVGPALAGEDLRLVYYVYTDDPPAEPSTETAYRHVNIWVDVPEAATE
jgi:uncharacterized membrane protein